MEPFFLSLRGSEKKREKSVPGSVQIPGKINFLSNILLINGNAEIFIQKKR